MSLSPGHFPWMLLPSWAPTALPPPHTAVKQSNSPLAANLRTSLFMALASVVFILLSSDALGCPATTLFSFFSRSCSLSVFSPGFSACEGCSALSCFHSPCSPGQSHHPHGSSCHVYVNDSRSSRVLGWYGPAPENNHSSFGNFMNHL